MISFIHLISDPKRILRPHEQTSGPERVDQNLLFIPHKIQGKHLVSSPTHSSSLSSCFSVPQTVQSVQRRPERTESSLGFLMSYVSSRKIKSLFLLPGVCHHRGSISADGPSAASAGPSLLRRARRTQTQTTSQEADENKPAGEHGLFLCQTNSRRRL